MRGRALPSIELEVVGASTGVAIVAGALAVEAPYLAALTGTLAALALAGWVAVRTGRPGRPATEFRPRDAAALSALMLGTVAFLWPAGPVDRFRALVLALALLPLWWTSSRRPA